MENKLLILSLIFIFTGLVILTIFTINNFLDYRNKYTLHNFDYGDGIYLRITHADYSMKYNLEFIGENIKNYKVNESYKEFFDFYSNYFNYFKYRDIDGLINEKVNNKNTKYTDYIETIDEFIKNDYTGDCDDSAFFLAQKSKESGLRTKLITGYYKEGEEDMGHIWIAVYREGKWMEFDSTGFNLDENVGSYYSENMTKFEIEV